MPADAQTVEVARVGNQVITTEHVRQTIAHQGYNVFEPASARQAVGDLVDAEVLAAAARRDGYLQDAEVAERIRQVLVEKFVADKVDRPLVGWTPSEEELRGYYEAHLAEFSQPALARAQVLTIMVQPDKAAEALARATNALAALQKGESFEQVAAREADEPSERVSQGVATWFTEGHVNRRYPAEVTTALFQLGRPAEVAGPIQTPRGVYLVKLDEKRPAIARSFAEAKSSVERAVLHAKRQQAYADLCAKLRQEFPVKLDEAQLSRAVESSAPGSGPPKGPIHD